MIVIVYGYEGSGPEHWQRWLHQQLQENGIAVVFPELPDPVEPSRDRWVAELAKLVAASPTRVTFVAHSLGCWAVDHFIDQHGCINVQAALLVAPPSPHLIFEAVESFLPPPLNRQAWSAIAARSLMISSDDDEFASAEEIGAIAAGLGVPYETLPAAGHINSASGYGPWPRALQWLL